MLEIVHILNLHTKIVAHPIIRVLSIINMDRPSLLNHKLYSGLKSCYVDNSFSRYSFDFALTSSLMKLFQTN